MPETIETIKMPGERAVVVDHVLAGRAAGEGALHNLRSLSDMHDRQINELPDGKRRNGGVFTGSARPLIQSRIEYRRRSIIARRVPNQP